MSALSISGSLDAEIKKELAAFKQQCVDRTKDAVRLLTQEMMDRTPVWSGKTVRNYVWGVNGLPGGGQIEPEGGVSVDPKDRGRTGFMGLGEEPNRAANEDAARAEMEGVIGGVDELVTFTVTNFSDIWDLVDNGSAPTPERARNPGGVSILAEQAAKAKLGGDFK